MVVRDRHFANEPGGTVEGLYWVWRYVDATGQIQEEVQQPMPMYGGYFSEKKYGNPNYCPTATRWHVKRFAEKGIYPNLVWFDSVIAAVFAGFSPCGSCILRGEKVEEEWRKYLEACEILKAVPVKRPRAKAK